MIGKGFKGDLSEVSIPDILEFLRTTQKTGVLSFRQERVRKSLYIQSGNVIFATSNVAEERLGDLLLAARKITREAFDQSAQMLGNKKRQGRILIELGAITPKDLWEGVQNQIREIVFSLFNWNRGIFVFSAGELPSRENITADVGITELIVEGIRKISNIATIYSKFPSRDIVLGRADSGLKHRVRLEPFENHVFDLIDGQRTMSEICYESEIGETETFRVLYMLLSIGYVKVKGRKMDISQSSTSHDISAEESRAIIASYNRMYSYLYRYLLREVGPITEHVLSKYFLDVREANSSILQNVSLRKDGTLDDTALQTNIHHFSGKDKKDLLVSSLNEFLYSSILAVKRTLGPEHESRVIEALRDLRPDR